MVRRVLVASVLFFSLATVCLGQSAASAPSGSSGSSGSASSSGKQTSSNSSASSDAKTKDQDSPATDKKKTKKVFTNDDLGTAGDSASVAGSGRSNACGTCNSSRSNTPAASSKDADYDWLVDNYQRKLAPLRSDLADLDRKIQLAKEAKGNAREDTAAWIDVWNRKRADIQAKIDRIQEEARRNGVLPGDLRD
jgi:hypothetical protein